LFRILKNWRTQQFGNWICFHPQVKGETPVLFGPIERANVVSSISVSSSYGCPVIEVSSM
jgi:hypothetical protein